MEHKANYYDNVAMESFFRILKVKQAHRNRNRISSAAIEYVKDHYDQKRKQSVIGHLISVVFDQAKCLTACPVNRRNVIHANPILCLLRFLSQPLRFD